MVGGDAVDPATAARVLERYAPQQLLHCYGPTESTTFATTGVLTLEDARTGQLPIGRPIANTRIYLLDAQGQLVPLGSTGEIYVGGDGVALGYLNRPELTTERFLPDPFHDVPGARMYRTGDLARYLPDGRLIFLGRNDQQVKIRGYRIEPGEIEARLAEHPAVREAVVMTQPDAAGEKRLVAYVTAHNRTPELVSALRAHLSARLPDYMLPSAFVLMEKLPLTANGKVDRRILPLPDDQSFAHRDFVAPCTSTEKALAAIWAELLGLDRVGSHDDFFELGGHSLLAVKMISRAADFGLALNVNDLFQHPTLLNLAQAIKAAPVGQAGDRAMLFRKGNAEHSLFFLPTGTGDYSYVFGLMQQLDLEASIYVLPWQSAEQKPLPALEAMARRMVPMMKAVQPRGPYQLSGYSAGGVLAYALADQLMREGETVSFLGMIDTALLSPRELPPDPQMLLDMVEDRQVAEGLGENIGTFTLEALLDELRKLQQLPSTLSPDISAAEWRQMCHFIRVLRAYRAPKLHVPVYQFHAEEAEPTPEHLSDHSGAAPSPGEPSLGWKDLLSPSSTQYISIPGNHLTMMSDPQHRAMLGRRMTEVLARDNIC